MSILIILAIVYGAHLSFKSDLDEIAKTDPRYRQYLKDTLKL